MGGVERVNPPHMPISSLFKKEDCRHLGQTEVFPSAKTSFASRRNNVRSQSCRTLFLLLVDFLQHNLLAERNHRLPLSLAAGHHRDNEDVLAYVVIQDMTPVREDGAYLENMLRRVPNDPILVSSCRQLVVYVTDIFGNIRV